MDRAAFLAVARRLGFRADAYALEAPADEAYCLFRARLGWWTFYAERGLETNPRRFATEDEPLIDLLHRLDSDASTRA